MTADNPYEVPAVARAVSILDAFAERSEWTISGLAARLAMPKTTVYRIILTLCESGVLEEPLEHRYRLAARVCTWAHSYSPAVPVAEPISPVLDRLVETTAVTANVGVLRHGESLLVVTRCGPHAVRSATWPGRSAPLHLTAMGKSLLSLQRDEYLTKYMSRPLQRCTDRSVTRPDQIRKMIYEVRANGYSWERDELEEGLWCVGAPVCRLGAETLAISVSAPAHLAARRWSQLLDQVRWAAVAARRAVEQHLEETSACEQPAG